MTQDARLQSDHNGENENEKKIRLLAWLGWQEVEEHPAREERKKPSNWQEPAAAIEDFKVVRFDFIFSIQWQIIIILDLPQNTELTKKV